jgi:hypothetical protein
LSDEQAVELIRQLPAEQQISLLVALAQRAGSRRDERMAAAQQGLRELCRKRGLDWDVLSEEQREILIDDLIHEDRLCGR